MHRIDCELPSVRRVLYLLLRPLAMNHGVSRSIVLSELHPVISSKRIFFASGQPDTIEGGAICRARINNRPAICFTANLSMLRGNIGIR